MRKHILMSPPNWYIQPKLCSPVSDLNIHFVFWNLHLIFHKHFHLGLRYSFFGYHWFILEEGDTRRNSKGMGSETGKERKLIVLMSKLLLQANVAPSHWRPSETLGGRCFRTDAKKDKKAESFIHQSLSLTIDGHSWDINFLELLVWLQVLCSSAYTVAREQP